MSANQTVWAIVYGVVCVILVLAVLVEHRLVTDRLDVRTDRRTHDGSIYRPSIASRGKICVGSGNMRRIIED